MTNLDLEALLARVAQLEAQLAPTAPTTWPLEPFGVVEAEPRVTQALATLVGSPEQNYLCRDPRVVRQLVEAVALAYGVPAPARDVPKLWVPVLRRLATSRAAGRSWRAALVEAGLDVPEDIDARVQALRRECDDLWAELLPVVARAMETANGVSRARLREKLSTLFA